MPKNTYFSIRRPSVSNKINGHVSLLLLQHKFKPFVKKDKVLFRSFFVINGYIYKRIADI